MGQTILGILSDGMTLYSSGTCICLPTVLSLSDISEMFPHSHPHCPHPALSLLRFATTTASASSGSGFGSISGPKQHARAHLHEEIQASLSLWAPRINKSGVSS